MAKIEAENAVLPENRRWSAKQENQIKAVRSFIARAWCHLYCPGCRHGLGPVLKEAKDAEIPVFLLDRSSM